MVASFFLSPRHVTLVSAIALACQTVYAIPTKTPFAAVPPHLVNENTKTKENNVKPNIMFLVDDSGSMAGTVKNSAAQGFLNGNTNKQRVTVVKEALNAVVDKYQDRMHWNLATFWGTSSLKFYDKSSGRQVTPSLLDEINQENDDYWPNCNRWNFWTRKYQEGYYGKAKFDLDNKPIDEKSLIQCIQLRSPMLNRGSEVYNKYYLPNMIYNGYSLHYPGGGTKGPVSSTYLSAAQIKQYIPSIFPASVTPTISRYAGLMQTVLEAQKYRCQKNFIVLLSDGDVNGDSNDNIDAVLSKIANNRNNSKSAQRLYELFGGSVESWFNAQGFREPDRRGNQIGISASDGNGKRMAEYFSHALYENDLKTAADGKDEEGGSWDDPDYPKQNIQTFTVGFGGGISNNGRAFLTNMAISDANQSYYEADSADALVDAFAKIFDTIDKSSGNTGISTTSTSTPSNAANSGVEGLAALMSLDTNIWSSQLKLYKLNNDGKPTGDVSDVDYSGRRLLMDNGSTAPYFLLSNLTQAITDFGFTNVSEFRNAYFQWLYRNPRINDEQIEAEAAKIPEDERLIASYRKRTDSATDSARQMGDVIDGGPKVISAKDSDTITPAKFIALGSNDGMLYLFEKNSGSNSSYPYQLKLNYIPGGMQRESENETLAKAMPFMAQSDYGKSANPHIFGVNGGLTWVRTADIEGRQHQTVLLGNMGQGGRGAFAVNIAGCDITKAPRTGANNTVFCNNPVGLDADVSNWPRSVPLWQTPKTNNTLGYTISQPTLYPVSTTGGITQGIPLAAFIANGFPTNSDAVTNHDRYPTLYIYDVLGADMAVDNTNSNPVASAITNQANDGLIASISTERAGADELDTDTNYELANAKGEVYKPKTKAALSSPAVVDINFDSIADVAYAGDYNGDLYRFDLRGTPATWKAVKIYDGDSSQPITVQPVVYRLDSNRLIVLFGTGSDIYDDDVTNIDQQSFFGIYDDISNSAPTLKTKTSLQKQTLVTNSGTRQLTGVAINGATANGWYFDLAPGERKIISDKDSSGNSWTSSEKVVSRPRILLSTAFFTTRIYTKSEKSNDKKSNEETCKVTTTETETSGNSWLMAVNVKTGLLPESSKLGNDIAGKELGYLASGANIVGNGEVAGVDPAVDVNSNTQGGELTESGKTTDPGDNECTPVEDYRLEVVLARENNPLSVTNIKGKLCESRLIRINSRKIREIIN